MRIFTKGLLLGLILTLAWSTGDVLLSSRMYLGESRIHTIQQGEHLSKLAQLYYGNAEYWRQLALINRAPNADAIFPGEKILLPSVNAVDKLAEANRLSEVNNIVDLEEQAAFLETENQAKEFTNKDGGFEPATEPKQSTEPKETAPTPAEQTTQSTEPAPAEPNEPLEYQDEPAPVTNPETDATANKDGDMVVPQRSQDSESDVAPQQAEESKSSNTWIWIVLLGLGIVSLAYGLVSYRRRHAEDEDQPEEKPDPITSSNGIRASEPRKDTDKGYVSLPSSFDANRNKQKKPTPV